MQKTILLLTRALGIPYVNRIDFFAFCVHKNVSQKKWFLYINEDYNDFHDLKTMRTFLYTKKAQKIAKRFYIQKARHFLKSYTISDTFLYTKSHTLYVTGFFMKILRLAFI